MADAMQQETIVGDSPDTAIPDITFVVPVYNLAPYLEETLNSLRQQTLRSLEIVCVDDGSTDESARILDEIASRDERVIVVHQQNAGVSNARNVGIDVAQGQFICFVDGDDVLYEDTAQRLINAAHENQADIVVYGAYSFPRKVRWVYEMFGPRDIVRTDNGCDIMLSERGCLPSAANKMYRASLLKDYRLRFDERFVLGEDTFLQFNAFPLAKTVVFMSDRFYGYRFDRPGSAVTEGFKLKCDQLEKHLDVFCAMADLWAEKGYLTDREGSFLEAIAFIFYDFEDMGEEDRRTFASQFASAFLERFSLDDVKSIYPVERWLYTCLVDMGRRGVHDDEIAHAWRAFECKMRVYRSLRSVKHAIRSILKGKSAWE